ncbi:sensor domain-containing protein [Nocardia halotolerans]|uniref:Sensor domain-containing protein n=1 Tax=Nocardia halotolerans TaxID=1755878 RepID=A0ABV8VJ63_9NOCA
MNTTRITPIGAGRRGTAGRRRIAGAAVVLVAVSTGCGQAVSGTPVAESAMSMRHVEAPIAELLPTPGQFPSRYPAVALPPQAAAAAAGDLDGVGMGATVSPVECTPPDPESDVEPAAVAVGTDDATRASLTVELSRTTEGLAVVRARLDACEEIRVRRAGAGSTVTTVLDEAALPGADEAISLRRTVIPDVGGQGLTQTMQSSVGRVGDVRITVTSMIFGAGEPDTAAVAELFATTVRGIRTR